MDSSLLEPPDLNFSCNPRRSVDLEEDEQEDSEKESRIAARRKRIQLKIEADRREALGEKPAEVDEEDVDQEKNRPSTKQMKLSEGHILKLITDGRTLVTNVKVAGESKEVTRRQEEEEERRVRCERLEAEVTAGAERFEEIMKKWSEGKGKLVPQDLQSLIAQQKKSCSAMVDEKEKLVGELQHELMAKDDQYVKYLKRQAADIDLILERMEAQAKMLLKGHRDELVEIEKSYERERRGLTESQKVEWEKIMEERSEKEKKFLDDREKRIDEHEAEVQCLRVQNSEAFSHIKIKLETDIQSLQQQIQQMKATFQLNAEKLEYNFQVLKKRDEENMVTISQQKRRLTRLQDTLNNHRIKLNKQEKACKSEMQVLVDDYRKNTEQYRELQKKVKHFQMIDTKRFHDVWKMNEGRTRKLASDVSGADEIIHKQQLGLDYAPPPDIDSSLTRVLPVKSAERDVSRATLYASKVVTEVRNEVSATSETLGVNLSATTPHYPLVVIKQVLELLCSECEFLMERKLLRLLAPLEKEEQVMMKLDSIFKAIGVENEMDIHLLVKYFIVDGGKLSSSLLSGKGQDIKLVVVHPNAVSKCLRTFVEDRQGNGADSLLFSKGAIGTQGSLYRELLDGSFWNQMANMVPEAHEKLWDALIDGLESYHDTLQARSSLIQDTDSLHQQNTELSILLQQYSHARVNSELMAPPTMQPHGSRNHVM